MKNHWNANRQRVYDLFTYAADRHVENQIMDAWDQALFEEDRLEFESAMEEAVINVNESFQANNGTLRGVVIAAIRSLEDALTKFLSALDEMKEL